VTVSAPVVLHVGGTFTFPVGFLVQKSAILARSGAGKTNASVVIVEELLLHGQQVVILDPPGAWWGLRSSADGEREGFPILIFGGEHGDLTLTADDGEHIATLLAQTRFSAIIDLSELTGGEMTKFVEAFARRLYEIKGPSAMRSPMLLVTEEADEVAPQNSQPDQRRMLGAMERIAKRGRMRGIGFLAVTQRSASLNKNVLSQIEVLIAMQTTDPRDIDAIDAWLRRQPDQNARQRLLAEIASLQVGEAFVWSPAWLAVFEKIRFRKRTTYDSSATPDPLIEVTAGPKKIATVEDMLHQMKPMLDSVERIRQRAQDQDAEIVELRAEVMRLFNDLEAAQAYIGELLARPDPVICFERVLVFDDPSFQVIQSLIQRYEAATTDLSGALARATLATITTDKNGQKPENSTFYDPIPSNSPQFPPIDDDLPKAKQKRSSTRRAPTVTASSDKGQPLPPFSRTEWAILSVLSQFELGRTRKQISFLSGYSDTSSTFDKGLGRLRRLGLVRWGTGGPIQITAEGMAAIHTDGRVVPTLPSGEAIVEWIAGRLKKTEAAIFRAVLGCHPRPLTVAEVSEQTGYSQTSSTFQKAFPRLRSLEIIDGRQEIVLHPRLTELIEGP
jgi:hypothetical protein